MGWPRFEVAQFDNLGELPDSIADLVATSRVPRHFFAPRFSATSALTLFPIDGQTWVHFGESGQWQRFLFDPHTAGVFSLLKASAARPKLLNSSLWQFSRCAEAILAKFPFYDKGSELWQWEAQSRRASRIIESIDPVALEGDNFWNTFLDDVANGDFATEDVILWDEGMTSGTT